jgi:protein gp37
MADQRDTGISWTDETWNPVVGCSIVSPACTNCYAMGMAARIERMSGGNTHYLGTTKVVNGKPVWTGNLVRAPDHIVTAPLRWKRPRRIFVNSMSDLFHGDMPEEWIDEVFAVMALSPQHTFQILTKRPERMCSYLTRDWASATRFHVESLTLPTISKNAGDAQERLRRYTSPGFPHPLENVWLGVTAEDQARADERIPPLLSTPAAVRFVSAEPLLGPLDLQRFMERCHANRDGDCRAKSCPQLRDGEPLRSGRHCPIDTWGIDDEDLRPLLDWVIVGGESGPGARPTHPDWVRSIRDQCGAAGVAFHFKQRGDWSWLEAGDGEWPTDLPKFCRIGVDGRRSPDGWPMQRVGKHFAGRTLDGKIHDAFPEAP